MSDDPKRLNDTNDRCRKCNGPTESIFGTGRAMWCPACESDKPEEKKETNIVASSDEDDPFGFHIIEIDEDDLEI